MIGPFTGPLHHKVKPQVVLIQVVAHEPIARPDLVQLLQLLLGTSKHTTDFLLASGFWNHFSGAFRGGQFYR